MSLTVGRLNSWRQCYYSPALTSIEGALQARYSGLIFAEPTYVNGLRIEIKNPENVGPEKALFEINFGQMPMLWKSVKEGEESSPGGSYSTIHFGFSQKDKKPDLAKTSFKKHLEVDEVVSEFEDFLQQSYEELGWKKLIEWLEVKDSKQPEIKSEEKIELPLIPSKKIELPLKLASAQVTQEGETREFEPAAS